MSFLIVCWQPGSFRELVGFPGEYVFGRMTKNRKSLRLVLILHAWSVQFCDCCNFDRIGWKLLLYVVEAEVGLLRVNQLIDPPITPAIDNVFSSFVVTLIVHFWISIRFHPAGISSFVVLLVQWEYLPQRKLRWVAQSVDQSCWI